jgi:hypothetical protein
MAYLEGAYYSLNTKSNTSGQWFKAVIALVGGSCLLLLLFGATDSSTTDSRPIVDLLATASRGRGLRGPQFQTETRRPISTCAVPKNKNTVALFKQFGIGKEPIARLALASVEETQRSVLCRHGEAELTPEEAETQRVAFLLSAGRDANGNIIEITEEVKEEVKIRAKDMAGVTGPFGFFDPLGFSTDLPAGKLLFYREVELKHGRVGMLASLGLVVAENFHPLFGGKIDVPSYLAFQQTPLQKFWPAVLAAVAIPEILQIEAFKEPSNEPDSLWAMKTDTGLLPGALGFDPLNLWPKDKKEQLELQNKEINNGRLAMIAAAGIIAQELATGKKIF